MELSQTTLHMAHKLTTPAMLGTVLTGQDTAPVNAVVGLGQSQLVVSDSNYFFVYLLIVL